MDHIKGCKSGFKSFFQYNEVSVRKYDTKKTINLKHQPELGACPCMRVGGFKRNPTGFSSGETEHNRRQTLKKISKNYTATFLLFVHFSNHRANTTAILVEPQEL